MKSITCVIALLLSLRTAASDSNAICELKDFPGNSNDWIILQELPLGCWTDFTTRGDGGEVHILNLLFSSKGSAFFSLNVTSMNPSVLIISSTGAENIHVLLYDSPAVDIYVTNGTSIQFVLPNRGSTQTQVAPSADRDSELLKWAEEKFGGVTSFTTAREPTSITLTGMSAKLFQRPSRCDLQPKTPADKPFIKLELSKPSNELKSCYMEHRVDQLHVINIPDNVGIRHVSLHLSSVAKLVLRGPPKTEWNINASDDIRFVSNNLIIFNNLSLPSKWVISDDAEDIRQKVKSFYNSTTMNSYSEIHLNASHIKLWIRDNTSASEAERVTSAPGTPAPTSSLSDFEMQLFSSPDYRSPLDPSSKVQSDKRIYAEISSTSIGDIPLSIMVSSCWVHGSMAVMRNMPFKEEACFRKDCPKRLSFSFEMLQDMPPSSWDIECAVKHCYDKFCTKETQVKRNLQVKPYIPNSNPCIEFGLSSVLGIAFGGFLIGVLLTGALWFIKIRTAYEGRGGESSSSKPRDDLPLEIR